MSKVIDIGTKEIVKTHPACSCSNEASPVKFVTTDGVVVKSEFGYRRELLKLQRQISEDSDVITIGVAGSNFAETGYIIHTEDLLALLGIDPKGVR